MIPTDKHTYCITTLTVQVQVNKVQAPVFSLQDLVISQHHNKSVPASFGRKRILISRIGLTGGKKIDGHLNRNRFYK